MSFLISREGMIPRNFLILTIILIVLSSCGLYVSPYLNAPLVNTVIDSGNAEIFNRTDNDPEIFRGYEIYYKYYTNSSLISVDDKTIFETSEPEPSDLTKVGYRRLKTVLTTEETTYYPMIPVDYSDRDSSFTLTINLPGTDVIPVLTYPGYSDITLRRNVTEYNSTSGKTEYRTFITSDHIDGNQDDRPSDEKTLSLYVFAYGKDDNVYNIYSKPVWLGRINYP